MYKLLFQEQYRLLNSIIKQLNFLGSDISKFQHVYKNDTISLGIINIRISNLVFQDLEKIFNVKYVEKESKVDYLHGQTLYNLAMEQWRQLTRINNLLDQIGIEEYVVELLESFENNNLIVRQYERNFHLSHQIIKRLAL